MLVDDLFDLLSDMCGFQNLKTAMPETDMQDLSVKGGGCIIKKSR